MSQTSKDVRIPKRPGISYIDNIQRNLDRLKSALIAQQKEIEALELRNLEMRLDAIQRGGRRQF